jgi:hypothetical protein
MCRRPATAPRLSQRGLVDPPAPETRPCWSVDNYLLTSEGDQESRHQWKWAGDGGIVGVAECVEMDVPIASAKSEMSSASPAPGVSFNRRQGLNR